MQVLLLARANKQLKEIVLTQFGDIRKGFGLKTLRDQLDNITHVGTDIGKFAAMPTGDIHAPAGIHIDIGGAANGEKGLLMCIKGGPIGRWIMQEHCTATPIAGVHRMAEGFGPTGIVVEHAAATGAPTIVLKGGHELIVEILVPGRVAVFGTLHNVIESNIPATTIIGVITRENIQVGINTGIKNITQTPAVNLHVRAIGADAYNPSSTPAEDPAISTNCLGKSKVAHGNVNPSINPHPNAVGGMVCAAFVDVVCTDSVNQNLLLV